MSSKENGKESDLIFKVSQNSLECQQKILGSFRVWEVFYTVGTKSYDAQTPGNVFGMESLKPLTPSLIWLHRLTEAIQLINANHVYASIKMFDQIILQLSCQLQGTLISGYSYMQSLENVFVFQRKSEHQSVSNRYH